jgi:hypothetical protein
MEIFLRENKSNLGEVSDRTHWMAKHAYLSDIFSNLNELNL